MIRQLLFLITAITLFGCATNENEESSREPDGTYRPSGFHAFINHGTDNKPISLLKADSLYHLFYSTNSQEWGHISSKDLLSWKPEVSFPFSSSNEGEVVWDGDNLTGFNSPWNVLTVDSDGLKLSYSSDGINWTTHEGNPVLETKGNPSIYWSSDLKNWVLTIANNDDLTFYLSSDLKEWKSVSAISLESGIEKASLLSYEGQWFVLSQKDELKYQLLDFSEGEFRITGEQKVFQGMQTGTYSILNNEESLIFLSANESSKAELPTFSTPLSLSLRNERLALLPSSTFKGQIVGKRRAKLSRLVTDGPSWYNFTIDKDFKELEVSISDNSSEVKIFWNKEDQSISFSGSALVSTEFTQKVAEKISANNLTIDLLIDHASIDLFFNGGEYATSLLAKPRTFFSKVEVQVDGEVYDAKGILYDIGT